MTIAFTAPAYAPVKLWTGYGKTNLRVMPESNCLDEFLRQ